MKTYINLKELNESYKLTKERFNKDLVSVEDLIDALDEALEIIEDMKREKQQELEEWERDNTDFIRDTIWINEQNK